MATIVTRSGKGSPLTNTEVDSNFTNLNTDKVEKSGDSMTGNLTFGDNDKAIFGAGSDLQIYHDGSNSWIKDAGTGQLILESPNAGVYIQNGATETMANFVANGAVSLYYDNSKKIETTSSGIDVTGTVTADGLTVDGSSTFNGIVDVNNTNCRIRLYETDTTDLNTQLQTNGGDFYLTTLRDDASFSKLRIKVDHSTGDISFYEDTGTTPKFFWDASAESLGIGTTSPNLHGWTTAVTLNTSSNGGYEIGQSGTKYGAFALQGDGRVQLTNFTANPLTFQTNNTERMRIDSNGKVGIGTSSPTTPLDVDGNITSRDGGIRLTTATSARGGVYTYDRVTGSGTDYSVGLFSETGLGGLWFATGGSVTKRMVIDDSGNVGIGTPVLTPTYVSTTSPALRIARTDAGYNYTEISTNGGSTSIAASGASGVGGTISFDRKAQGDSVWTESMRIDSSGNVGIGTSSPSTYAKFAAVSADDNNTMVAAASSGLVRTKGYLSSVGAGVVEATNLAQSAYAPLFVNGSTLLLGTNGSERMRIDSSGNLLVGKTASSGATAGAELRPAGDNVFTRASGQALTLRRNSSDGSILDFNKDGSTVGSIGASSGSMYIEGNPSTGKSGITFYGSSIEPRDAGNPADGAIDVGASGSRFKNLYLSGGVYLGGTGSANYLDDYEEGTWTPVLTGGSTDPTYTSGTNRSTYTKIGRTVYLNVDINLDITAVGSGQRFLSLPFASSGDKSYTSCFGQRNNSAFTLEDYKIQGYCASTYFYMTLQAGANGSEGTLSESHQRTGSSLRICLAIKYLTDS